MQLGGTVQPLAHPWDHQPPRAPLLCRLTVLLLDLLLHGLQRRGQGRARLLQLLLRQLGAGAVNGGAGDGGARWLHRHLLGLRAG